MSQNRHTHSAGETVARHRHDVHQLIHVSRGVLAIHTENGAWVACADRALWIPANTWHEHRVYGNTAVSTIAYPTVDAPLSARTPTVVAVTGLLRELLAACTEPDLPAKELRSIRAVLRDRLQRAHVQPLLLPTAHDPRLAQACDLVTDDLRQPRTINWLAIRVGASERTLARLFRAEFGTTYPQWRTTVRVFHAMIHLAQGASVTQTAQRCGWSTTSAFVDTFSNTMGRTPGTYRARESPEAVKSTEVPRSTGRSASSP